MKILTILLILFIAVPCYAKQIYNAYENRWETIPDNSNWNNQYNAFKNSWSYQPDDSSLDYNVFENTWEWDSGHNYDTDYNNSYDYDWYNY